MNVPLQQEITITCRFKQCCMYVMGPLTTTPSTFLSGYGPAEPDIDLDIGRPDGSIIQS